MANEISPDTENVKTGVSVIQINPIDVVEKFGKYQFVYDYSAIPLWLAQGFGLGNFETAPQTVNSKAQVGVFSKGNIVNVVRFQGNNAIIENVNYKEPDSNVVKSVWGELLGGAVNKKQLEIPKEYLIKVDDALEPTLLTGINYGANFKPQPVSVIRPTKQAPFSPVTQTTIEENASFVLAKDFQYVSGYGSRVCAYGMMCATDMVAQYSTIKAGTQVTGLLFRETDNFDNEMQNVAVTPINYKDYLSVKGYGSQGSVNIPVEYLTKEVPTNSGSVVPAEIDNKNLLLIVGAFLLGFALFSNNKTQ